MRTPAPGSLLGRIALTLVGVGLIATAVQGTFSYVDARRALRHEVLDRLASIQENKRRAIVASLSDAITRAQMLQISAYTLKLITTVTSLALAP